MGENKTKRLAKNTILLYIRMFVIMGITFYTTRVTLKILGVTDFGIYNTIGGVVVLFSFFNNALITTTQRFLSYYLGKENFGILKDVFSTSLIVHIIIGLFVSLLAEVVGLWFLYSHMSLPEERFNAAFWTLHLSVLMTFISVIRSPYNACLVAYENFNFYAYISILESIFKLVIVLVLVFFIYDYLILYCILLLIVTLVFTIAYIVYCNHCYEVTKIKLQFNRTLTKEISNFSFYSIFGNAANVGSQQGTALIVNSFTNVIVNAAIGICNQLSQGIFSFVTNFQMAFNPILIKTYAKGDFTELKDLLFKVSRFSYYLMIVVSMPVLFYCKDFLELWLSDVPPYSAEFCQFTIIALIIDTVAEPLWKTIQASGQIKKYQIVTSIIILSNIPIAFLVFYFRFSPVVIFQARIVVTLIAFIYRFYYIDNIISLGYKDYINSVLRPIVLVTFMMLFSAILFKAFINNYILASILIVCISLIVVFFMGMHTSERNMIKHTIISKLSV